MDVVKMCFPGIRDLVFGLPGETSANETQQDHIQTQLNFDIHGWQ